MIPAGNTNSSCSVDPVWLRVIGILLAIASSFLTFYSTSMWGAGTWWQNAMIFLFGTTILSVGVYGPIILFTYGAAQVRYRKNRPTCSAGNCPSCRYEWTGMVGDTCPECGRSSTSDQRMHPARLPIKRRIAIPLVLGVMLGGLFALVWLGADRAAYEKASAAYFRAGGLPVFVRGCKWPATGFSFVRNSADGPIGICD